MGLPVKGMRMIDTEVRIRRATPADARALAELMNIAGEGLPAHLWAGMTEPGGDVMDFGSRRVAQPEGGFSYTNAHVATVSGSIAGMLLGYRLPDQPEPVPECPPVVRPLLELEGTAPGSWYINGVATTPAHRGQGIGYGLMIFAETLARKTGAKSLSLIVAEGNVRARALYERLGYEVLGRRPIVTYPECPHAGDWLLMSKAVGARR